VKLSVIVPVYNERGTIKEVLERVQEVSLDKEIIIVDDGSTDGTGKEISEIRNQISNIKVIRHTENKGKGSSIRTALSYATGDVVIIQDADLEYEPQEYPRLLSPIKKDAVSVVYGSRFKGKSTFNSSSFIANKFLTGLTNLLYFSRLTDMETCYKCVRRDIMVGLNLESRKFDVEPEITAKLLRKGYNIVEVPISYRSRIKGKKIGIRDGIQAIFTLLKWRFK